MRVTLLSTYYENVGDDLIREGVQRQLRHTFNCEPTWRHISKSNPLSLYAPLSRFSHAPLDQGRPSLVGSLQGRAPRSIRHWDKAIHTDLFVFAGTPLFYFVGANNFLNVERSLGANWPEEIFAKRLEPADAPPFVALGVGSIYEGSAAELIGNHPQAADFLRRFLNRAKFVSTRDARTFDLLHLVCPPERRHILAESVCPSLWAPPSNRGALNPARKVMIGYSTESANWDLTKPVKDVLEKRRMAFDWVLQYFEERGYQVVVASHNRRDTIAQLSLDLGDRVRFAELDSAQDLTREANQAALTVTWRIHGAMASLAAGRPTVLFQTDARWPMAANLGAAVVDDRCLRREDLTAVLDKACARASDKKSWSVERLEKIKGMELSKIQSRLARALAGERMPAQEWAV